LKPKASVTDVSKDNVFTITFSDEMAMFSPILESDITFKMVGPLNYYGVRLQAYFASPVTLKITVLSDKPFTGADNEFIYFYFSSSFVSKNGASLTDDEVKGNTKEVPVFPDVVAAIGSSSNAVMATIIVTIISTNMMLAKSCELMWGFLNTVQIIFFMPLMSHYFPMHLKQFLVYLSSAKMEVDQVGISKDMPGMAVFDSDLNMPALNEDYENLGYESKSILVNAKELFTTVFSGLVTCIIVFAARAILFTLKANLKEMEEQLEEMEKDENISELKFGKSDKKIPESSKTSKMVKKWAKSKICFENFRQGEGNEYGVQIQFFRQTVSRSLP
jgi:hypothetical protein